MGGIRTYYMQLRQQQNIQIFLFSGAKGVPCFVILLIIPGAYVAKYAVHNDCWPNVTQINTTTPATHEELITYIIS